MSAMLIFTLFIVLMIISLAFCAYAVKRGMKPAKAVVMQLCSFAILFMATFAFAAVTASADEEIPSSKVAETTVTSEGKSDKEWNSLAMALVMGLSCLGGGIAVAAAAPAAIGATSEDPKAFGKAIVFVGLAEGVPIFGLLVALIIKFI